MKPGFVPALGTPKNTKLLFESMAKGDCVAAAKYLDNIVALRDCFVANDLMPSFTASMNLLGCEDNFHQEYNNPYTEEAYNTVRTEMIRIGEI